MCAGAMSSQAQADTYVFITNTTPETVTVNVNHYGTRTLTQGSQWAQEATSIGAYETKRVLRYNRNMGVKSGQTYNFDTVVTGGGSSVTLKQSMTGTWTGSTIKHGAAGTGFNTPWFTDRKIYHYDTTYAGKAAETAFKSEYTGGFDDFHYTIHQKTVTEPLTTSSSDSESWSWKLPIGRGQVDLATVVAHEAGHLIGLEHSQVPGAQMAPVYAGPKRFLEADDVRRAQQYYGSRS